MSRSIRLRQRHHTLSRSLSLSLSLSLRVGVSLSLSRSVSRSLALPPPAAATAASTADWTSALEHAVVFDCRCREAAGSCLLALLAALLPAGTPPTCWHPACLLALLAVAPPLAAQSPHATPRRAEPSETTARPTTPAPPRSGSSSLDTSLDHKHNHNRIFPITVLVIELMSENRVWPVL